MRLFPSFAFAARAFGTLIVAVAPFVFLLAAPPFAFGIWFQTEPVTAGVLALGAASGLGLLGLDLTGHAVWALTRRAHIRVLVAFLIWNALVSLTQDFPGRGWLGTPEVGQGILAFLALLLLTLLAMALWPYCWPRWIMAAASVLAALAIGGMDALLPFESAWRPAKYAGYAGIVGPSVLLIVTGVFRRAGWRVLALGVPVAVVPVAFSGNKTAIVLLCVLGPLVYLALRLALSRLPLVRSRQILAWLPIAALLLTLFVIGAATAYGDYDPLYSVRSRGLLILAAAWGLLDHPLALLTGFGWGGYNDILYQHNFLPGVFGYTDGVWDPNWEAVGAGAFHVHDDIFEAILGGGLIGGLLYALFLPTIIAGARRGMLAIGATGWFLIAGSLCFWFPFLLSYPFLALAIAATTSPMIAPVMAGHNGAGHRAPAWGRMVLLALAAMLTIGATMTVTDARGGSDRLAALNRQSARDIPMLGAAPPDHARAGVHLWRLALTEAAFVDRELAAGRPISLIHARWFARLLDEVDRWIADGRAGVRLEALSLALRNELMAKHEHTNLAGERTRALPLWEASVLRVILHSPDRTDVAVPYLAFMVAKRQYDGVIRTCDRIFALHPGDRVCLWYNGLTLIADPATESEGLGLMYEALKQRVETVVPVPNAARTLIETHVPAEFR